VAEILAAAIHILFFAAGCLLDFTKAREVPGPPLGPVFTAISSGASMPFQAMPKGLKTNFKETTNLTQPKINLW
jgi:hypothetical protein